MKILKLLVLLALLTTNSYSQESLMIHWPEEYEWKVLSNQENEKMHLLELIPGKENGENWTLLGQMMSMKGTTNMSMDHAKDIFLKAAREYSPDAKITVIDRADSVAYPWILFTIENPSFKEIKGTESQLWYIRQGATSLFANFIAKKEKTLEEEFVREWRKVFVSSEIVEFNPEDND